jgi:enoyl-CoA hydratase/carnithine racemase
MIGMAEELLFTKTNHIATITLNRPDKLNTFHDGMLAAWAAALQECQADDTVKVVVLTAAGRVFCAGGDLSSMGRQEGNPALYIGDYLRNHVHPVAVPSMPCRSRTSVPSTAPPPGQAWTWP